MKVIEQNKSIISGAIRSVKQSIATEHIARAAYLVRDQLYSDKIKATFCETLLNAVDEHRKHNVNTPVEVVITNSMLIIRDFAKGLTPDKVEQVFFQFFESTKSDNNEAIGGFGIGAKAPGSYANIYYVDSYFGGKKYCYVSTINGYEASASLISTEDCDINNTGICVRVPIDTSKNDFDDFCRIAYDMAKQIGFYSNKTEVAVYIKQNINVFTYDDWAKVKVANDLKPESDYKKLDADAVINFNNECLLVKNTDRYISTFRSDFFRNCGVFAYDGDMAYKLTLSRSQLQELNCAYIHNKIILFTFERGSLPILPSREGIAKTSAVDAWWSSKVKKVKEAIAPTAIALKDSFIKAAQPFSKAAYMYKRAFSPFEEYIPQLWAGESINRSAIITNIFTRKTGRLNYSYCHHWVKIAPDYENNTIFLVYDIMPKRKSRKAAIDGLNEYINKIHPSTSTDDGSVFKLSDFDYVCSVEGEEIAKFESFVKTAPYLRKDIDYYYISDIEEYIPETKKTTRSTYRPKLPTSYLSGYCVFDIKSTVVFTRADKDDVKYGAILYRLKNYGNNSLRRMLSANGYNDFALVSQRNKDVYISEGAIDISEIDFESFLYNSIKKQQLVFCSGWLAFFINRIMSNSLSTLTDGKVRLASEYKVSTYFDDTLTESDFNMLLERHPNVTEWMSKQRSEFDRIFIDKMNNLDQNIIAKMHKVSSYNPVISIPETFVPLRKLHDEGMATVEKESKEISSIICNLVLETINEINQK